MDGAQMALPFLDLVAAVSESLAAAIPNKAVRGRTALLPIGVDIHRFRPIPRDEARRELGLAPDGAYILFPADPSWLLSWHSCFRRPS